MIEVTKAIVLSTIKYGDTSLIAACYTEKCGIKSYMLKGVLTSKKGKLKSAYFQPLTQLVLTANHNNKGLLNTIRDVEVGVFYSSIYANIKKQTIALFIAETLFFSLREEEKNEAMFTYLETAFSWLDTHDTIANFHLLFLLNLTKFLGFYPEVKDLNFSCFDLLEGQFCNSRNANSIVGDDLIQFKKIFGINFDALHTVDFNAASRQGVLLTIIRYYEFHLSGFKRPKSLNILKTVFT